VSSSLGMVSRMTALPGRRGARFPQCADRCERACAGESAGVDLRKEIAAENADEQNGQKRKMPGNLRRRASANAGDTQGSPVAIRNFSKLRSKPCDSGGRSPSFLDVLLAVIFIVRAEEIHGHGRHDGARPHVGSQHGEAYGFGQWNDRNLATPAEKTWE